MAPEPVYVVGVGLTKFLKPRGVVDYTELGFEAAVKSMLDAGINYDEVDQGVACYVYGDSTSGQRVFYQFGMTSIPIYNVNNNCSTGSTGLYMGRNLIAGGAANVVLVVGFEKMFPGSLPASAYPDRSNPLDRTNAMMAAAHGVVEGAPSAAQLFGNAGREYMEKFGATADDFAEIARVSHLHSRNNPYSQFREVYSKEQILAAPVIHAPLTKLQCSPTSDGAAAVVLVSHTWLEKHPEMKGKAVLIAGQAMATDAPSMFSRSAMDLVGYEMTKIAAQRAMGEAGIEPEQVKVVELHDCFSTNEMVTIDALGLCEHGKAHEMVRKGDITYGGKIVVNPSGGLISKGHPLGATGLAQCCELVWQLRGWASNRLVSHLKVALQHNLGLGGAAVVTVYRRYDGKKNHVVADEHIIQSSGVAYNPAIEARGISEEDANRVLSKTKISEWMRATVKEKQVVLASSRI
ncbi:hypothetical protein YB2330_004378 [Saitoella coloradoensis]